MFVCVCVCVCVFDLACEFNQIVSLDNKDELTLLIFNV